MRSDLLEQLKGYILERHFNEARFIDFEDVSLIAESQEHMVKGYTFKVQNYYGENATVKITLFKDKLRTFYCNCSDFKRYHSCSHIPASIMNSMVFDDYQMDNKGISKRILELFSHNQNIVRKKVNLVLYLTNNEYSYYNYSYQSISLKMKMGYDKLYTLGQKYNAFKRTVEDGEGKVYFGVNFTFNPEESYFSSEDQDILDIIFENGSYNYDNVGFSQRGLSKLLDKLRDKTFYYNDILIEGIKSDLPFDISLSKKDDLYKLKVDYSNLEKVTEDYEYVFYKNNIYHLNKGYQKLIQSLEENELTTLEFTKEELNKFNVGIMPIIKNNLKVSNNLKNIISSVKPTVRLYFELNDDNIICNFKLLYTENEIDYFDTTEELLRDISYEQEVINDLKSYYFKIENNTIYLDDLELIVNFMENGLNELTTKYEIFTSEKLKSLNIKKKINVSSNFSIGEDNIMRYSFSIDDINDAEINNLIKSLKNKKKYYKLKNGDIVSLEDNSLSDLSNLLEDLDIDAKDTEGEIPKYQAIYLDYLKRKKYPSIKTNNLFDNFINNFNEYKNNTVDFNDAEKKLLRNYQLEGVEWLYNIHKCDLGGILADEMGLGKTIQTIYFFRKLFKDDKESKFLVVCPTSLCYNWLKEFEMYDKLFKVCILNGNKDLRTNNLDNKDIQVYITSYGTLREDIDLYQDKKFKVCVIDEAQNIKNPNALITRAVKKIKADTKIALTGTPLENSILELWSIFDFIMPGYLNTSIKFKEKYNFKDMNEEAQNKIALLKNITSPFILRRKKSDVTKELPDKIENNIFIDLNDMQKKIYAVEVESVKKKIEELLQTGSFNSKKIEIITLLMRLRQICIDPHLIYENYSGESSKIEELVKTVLMYVSNGHKILLFTSFKKALDIVREEFKKNKITFYQIDGSVTGKTRQELVDKFNNDDTNVFLITLKSGGTGLNLTSADVVIHLDLWWNPQVENQATDRAHRIGQTKKVEVIKLIANGTIEERILELQKKKQLLADKLIEKGEEGNINLASLTEKDIKKLLDF